MCWRSERPLYQQTLDRQDCQPTIVTTKGLSVDIKGRPSLSGPGHSSEVTLEPYSAGRRVQEIVFEIARDLTRAFVGRGNDVPTHVLFPQDTRNRGALRRGEHVASISANRVSDKLEDSLLR